MQENFWQKLVRSIEQYLPMKLGSLVLFLFVIYFIFIVGRSVYMNYNANKDITVEENAVASLKKDIVLRENEINYLSTYSYREKEARSKLGYTAAGEKMMAVPFDKIEAIADQTPGEVAIKVPNYIQWWRYFIE